MHYQKEERTMNHERPSILSGKSNLTQKAAANTYYVVFTP